MRSYDDSTAYILALSKGLNHYALIERCKVEVADLNPDAVEDFMSREHLVPPYAEAGSATALKAIADRDAKRNADYKAIADKAVADRAAANKAAANAAAGKTA